jgi:ATP-binding cassette subfamily C protein
MQANWLSINRNVGYVDEAMPILQQIRSTARTESRFQRTESPNGAETTRTGGLSFNEVEFAYPDAKFNTIKNVSFTVGSGEKIAIVGDSGAGKTTLANLILGLLVPTSGKVEYECIPKAIFDVGQSETGYLPQKPYIFSGSILENVCLTSDESIIDFERFQQSIQQAQILNFVESLEFREATIAGPSGISLSGGERQRIALARVLYLNPSVIVLDEPTSSLDSETDDFVSKTLTSPELKSTVFVVAHKYSTVRSVNRILYLEDGRVIAFGTWDDIMRKVPRFALQAKLQGFE